MNIKNMTVKEMADCVNNMLEQIAFHATEPINNYYDVMVAAYNLYGFLHYDAGCEWQPDEWEIKSGGEPFDF